MQKKRDITALDVRVSVFMDSVHRLLYHLCVHLHRDDLWDRLKSYSGLTIEITETCEGHHVDAVIHPVGWPAHCSVYCEFDRRGDYTWMPIMGVLRIRDLSLTSLGYPYDFRVFQIGSWTKIGFESLSANTVESKNLNEAARILRINM